MVLSSHHLTARRLQGNIIRFAPPLVLSEEQLREACGIIASTITSFD